MHLLDSFVSRASILTASFSDHFQEGLEYYLAPFSQWSALHTYIEYFIREVLSEDFDRASSLQYARKADCQGHYYCPASPAYLLCTDMLKQHDLDHGNLADELENWVEIGTCYCANSGQAVPDSDSPDWDRIWEDFLVGDAHATLIDNLAEEVFFVVFANRTFLYKFNLHMASYVQHATPFDWVDDADRLFRRDVSGVLKRAAIPTWAQRAVFFRDRGRCCFCERDLGGTYSPVSRSQYDHIVPLAAGGLNDVSNLQLLCNDCNRTKSAEMARPSQVYDRWFPVRKDYFPQHVPTLEEVVLKLHRDGVNESDPG